MQLKQGGSKLGGTLEKRSVESTYQNLKLRPTLGTAV